MSFINRSIIMEFRRTENHHTRIREDVCLPKTFIQVETACTGNHPLNGLYGACSRNSVNFHGQGFRSVSFIEHPDTDRVVPMDDSTAHPFLFVSPAFHTNPIRQVKFRFRNQCRNNPICGIAYAHNEQCPDCPDKNIPDDSVLIPAVCRADPHSKFMTL